MIQQFLTVTFCVILCTTIDPVQSLPTNNTNWNEFDEMLSTSTMSPTTTTTSATTSTTSTTTTTTTEVNNSSEIEGLIEILDGNFSLPTTTPSPTEFSAIDYTFRCKDVVEVYSNCSNSCPASCEDPQRKVCRNYCWKGCECAPGHVKNYRWQCIPFEECPKCAENEHYRNCGSNCEATCGTYQNMPVYCNNRASCKRGCFCNYGFVRDETKNEACVPVAECPQKCPDNEYWEPSGAPCIRTPQNPRPPCLFDEPKPACVCNTGFKRNPITQECQPVSKLIEKVVCGANETHSFCGSDCATNCFDESKRHMCPTLCKRGCFCNEGYRRDNAGNCVLPDDCKQWSPNSGSTPVFRV